MQTTDSINKLEPAPEVEVPPSEYKIHEHGFIRLVDRMGDDHSICDAARVSYGKGTRNVNDNRNLIRYLLRHRHTTPFEMCEVKFHIKLPIFVMRQHIRHRTASVNEYSGRYSIMKDEFYIPALDYIQPQSRKNKQGREGELTPEQGGKVQQLLESHQQTEYDLYQILLNDNEEADVVPELKGFPGIARETARGNLPVANYTECYWKINLHNLMHYLGLRMDAHAQREIRDYADAMYKLIQPWYPFAMEAFQDFKFQSRTFSRMELEVLSHMLTGFSTDQVEEMCKGQNMSKREITEFVTWFGQC